MHMVARAPTYNPIHVLGAHRVATGDLWNRAERQSSHHFTAGIYAKGADAAHLHYQDIGQYVRSYVLLALVSILPLTKTCPVVYERHAAPLPEESRSVSDWTSSSLCTVLVMQLSMEGDEAELS